MHERTTTKAWLVEMGRLYGAIVALVSLGFLLPGLYSFLQSGHPTHAQFESTPYAPYAPSAP